MSLSYPCIVYQRDTSDTRYANDTPYLRTKRYTITVMETDIDSELPDLVGALPMCSHSRTYVVDNIVHDVFDIFF